jgi:hypothetical protein
LQSSNGYRNTGWIFPDNPGPGAPSIEAVLMIFPTQNLKIYIALGSTNMHKSIDGLSILVSEKLNLDLFSGHMAA